MVLVSPGFTGQLTSISSHVSHLDSIVFAFLVFTQGKSSFQTLRKDWLVRISSLA